LSDRLIHSSMTRISDLEAVPCQVKVIPREEWENGDYVVTEVVADPHPWRLELSTGRMVELAEGDLVVGALGRRHATLEATGTWEAVDKTGRMELLTSGGLLGRCTSRSSHMPPLGRLRYQGHLMRGGEKLTMGRFGLRAPAGEGVGAPRPFSIPTLLIVGTSMSAGKTASARIAIRRLTGMGLSVVAAKVTGAGRYRDVLTMADSGADPIFDFVDAGLPSTVCPADEYAPALEGMLSAMEGSGADVAVVEVGASPLEPYNGDVAVERLRPSVGMTILCASDPYAVVGLVQAFELRPELVTGIASNTRAGVELVGRLTGIPCMDIRAKVALPALDDLLKTRLGVSPRSPRAE
jgi:hypothetical protein